MFDKDEFIQSCMNAVAEGLVAVKEVVTEAVSDGAGLMSELGEPTHAGITTIYRSPDLTIINFVWAPCMRLLPHDHQMFSAVGIYSGREDNIFWRRTGTTIEAAKAKSFDVGDVVTLGNKTIHSVLNPIGKMTCAIHVYGGDIFEPNEPRSEWDHETLTERPWNMDTLTNSFREAEARFSSNNKREDLMKKGQNIFKRCLEKGTIKCVDGFLRHQLRNGNAEIVRSLLTEWKSQTFTDNPDKESLRGQLIENFPETLDP